MRMKDISEANEKSLRWGYPITFLEKNNLACEAAANCMHYASQKLS